MQTNVTNFFKKRSSADTSDDITGCSGKRQATESQIYATLDSEENVWLNDSPSVRELSDTNASDIETLAGPTSISLSVMPGADRIIERCTRKPPGPGDISSGKAEGPTQSLRIIFPSKCFGTKQRAFRQAWYDSHKWLEYSISQDSAYCFCCRMLPPPNKRASDIAFTSTGYRQRKKATEKDAGFSQHERSDYQRDNFVFVERI